MTQYRLSYSRTDVLIKGGQDREQLRKEEKEKPREWAYKQAHKGGRYGEKRRIYLEDRIFSANADRCGAEVGLRIYQRNKKEPGQLALVFFYIIVHGPERSLQGL